MVLQSAYPDLIVPSLSLGEYLLQNFRSYSPDKLAVVSAFQKSRFTYRELINAVFHCKRFLMQKGLKKGETVALCCPNIPEFIVALLGTVLCHGIVTTCNPLFTEYEILHQLRDSKPKFVFTVVEHKKCLMRVQDQCDFIQEVFIMEDIDFCRESVKVSQSSFSETSSQKSGNINLWKDTVMLPYSSGTTGKPKGVMLSHRNFVSGLVISRINWKLCFHDVEYLVLPLFHIYGMMRCLSNIDQGATVVLDRRFNVERAAKAFEMYKVTICPIVPPMLLSFSKSNVEETHDLTSLRTMTVGAAPIAPDLVKSVSKKFNCVIDQTWGMTEITGITSIMNLVSWGASPLATGALCPMYSIKICEVGSSRELGAKERGEILVKGPTVMLGYLNNQEATESAFDKDGFLHTGDIGYFDDLHQIYVVDRVKELIKYKGFQVAPAEIEHVLMHHPHISDAAVIGVPDKEAGEVAKALIVKKLPSLTTNNVHSYVAEKLSKYKQLYGGIEFVEKIPKSASGKILRRILRDQNRLKMKSKI